MTKLEEFRDAWAKIIAYESYVRNTTQKKLGVVVEFTSNGYPIIYSKFFRYIHYYDKKFDVKKVESIYKINVDRAKNIENNVQKDIETIKNTVDFIEEIINKELLNDNC